jgi:sulfotransferase family protein
VKTIVWLASYPKSGNTWFRAFLANLLRDADEPAHINALNTGAIASARELFDEVVGIDAADLTPDEIDALRPAVYRKWAEAHDDVGFHKIHDAFIRLPNQRPMIPAEATSGALYFVRNPLDVAVSYANHSRQDLDTVIGWMADEAHCFAGGPRRLHEQLRQQMLTWSGHVTSWLDHDEFPVHVLRYEDMRRCPEPTFTAAAAFAGVATDPDRVARALAFASFEELQRQEAADGFREKAPGVESFFYKGQVGSWREELTDAQAARVVADHGAVMERLGYLDAAGRPVF